MYLFCNDGFHCNCVVGDVFYTIDMLHMYVITGGSLGTEES